MIAQLAEAAARAIGGDALTATMLILFVSALLSGIIDDIPYVAAMSPVVLQLTEGIADPVQAEALWWSLAIEADFGGNLTAIGAAPMSSCSVLQNGPASRFRSGNSPRRVPWSPQSRGARGSVSPAAIFRHPGLIASYAPPSDMMALLKAFRN